MKYQFLADFAGTPAETIKRIDDSVDPPAIAFIPKAETNRDYQAYLAWVEEGGVTEAVDE